MERDPQAFVAHYEEFKNRLFTYLMYRVGFDRELAEDSLMDIVLKAYEHFDRFDPQKGSFKAWIFTIAHNYLKNRWRDHGAEVQVSLETLHEEGFDPVGSDLSKEATDPYVSEHVQKILSLLAASEREIIALRYLQDLDTREIAQILNKEEVAVRVSLSRALKHFKDLYQKIYKLHVV
jgi:RNA polymerase sigma-70 factor (ECF subfamily)